MAWPGRASASGPFRARTRDISASRTLASWRGRFGVALAEARAVADAVPDRRGSPAIPNHHA